VAHLTLHMHRDPSRLSFEGTFLKWKPGDSLSYGFNGLLQSRRVSAILDRVDLDSLVSRHPAGLLNPAADPGSLAAAGVHISTIRRWSEPITRASREGSFNQHLALGRLPLGMYRITIENRAEKANSDPGLPSDVTWPRATAWALVTRMGLVSKASRGGVLAYVVDSQSGRPLPRVPVTLHSSGQPSSTVISAAKTSPQGLARLATAGSPMESQGVLIARDGDAAAATSIELNSPGSDGVSFNNDD